MSTRTVNSIKKTHEIYQGTLSFFGVAHPAGKKTFCGYHAMSEFRQNVKAPFEILIISAGSVISSLINCIESISLFLLNLAVVDISEAKNQLVDLVNNAALAVYSAVKGLWDTVISVVDLFSRTLFSVKEALMSCVSTEESTNLSSVTMGH